MFEGYDHPLLFNKFIGVSVDIMSHVEWCVCTCWNPCIHKQYVLMTNLIIYVNYIVFSIDFVIMQKKKLAFKFGWFVSAVDKNDSNENGINVYAQTSPDCNNWLNMVGIAAIWILLGDVWHHVFNICYSH